MTSLSYQKWEVSKFEKIEGLDVSISADLYNDGRDDVALFYFESKLCFSLYYKQHNF